MRLMQVEQIVALLIAERDRLTGAIKLLQDPIKRRGRPVGSGRKRTPRTSGDQAAPKVAPTPAAQRPGRRKRKLSAAGRKAIGDAARKRWAAIKAGKAASPFAKS